MKNMVCRVVGILTIAFGGHLTGTISDPVKATIYAAICFSIGSIIYDLAHRKEDY
ncbi:UNVERIFIED_ORG: hypothetical protein Xoosp15_174 [Xanthomonas phage Xoo-sp15]